MRERVAIVKPTTYMNRSGNALGPLLDASGFDVAQEMLVVVDDFQLPLGSYRLRARGSAGGHNGLSSIENRLGSQEYGRLRIGVGPVTAEFPDPADFVLSPFEADEVDILSELLPTMTEAVECWIKDGMEVAMNRFNKRMDAE